LKGGNRKAALRILTVESEKNTLYATAAVYRMFYVSFKEKTVVI